MSFCSKQFSSGQVPAADPAQQKLSVDLEEAKKRLAE